MPEAFIVDAVRTPVGKRGGGLAAVHPADLGAHVLSALVERTGIDPAAVDDVIFGCADTIGSQAGDIARTGWLAAGLPDHVPGTTVDRQCGSSQQAVHFAAQAVMSGTADVVVAGGVQNMSAIPISRGHDRRPSRSASRTRSPASAGWRRRYGDADLSQFRSAEMIAGKWGITRLDMERFALRATGGPCAAIAAGPSSGRSPRWSAWRRTSAPARHVAGRRSARCRRSSQAAGSPRRRPANLRRRGRPARGVRAGRPRPRRAAPGPDPPPVACAAPTRSGC